MEGSCEVLRLGGRGGLGCEEPRGEFSSANVKRESDSSGLEELCK